MTRSRPQNLRSVFILLFLNVAFFLLEQQDEEKYARLFSFDWEAVLRGEVWRAVTWQFTQAGTGWLEALALFITLLLLYLMGSAVEEEWGTRHFVALFVVSTLGSAGVAAYLGIPLLGTYFVYYTLLFVYAAAFPGQTLYLFATIPVRVRFIAFISFAVLVAGIYAGGMSNVAALVGAMLGLLCHFAQRVRIVVTVPQQPRENAPRIDITALHNAARVAAMKHALGSGSVAEVERLIAQNERDTVPGVNICPPADYKPDHTDGYCIRCEGFAECAARYLRARVPAASAAVAPASAGTTAASAATAAEPAPLA